MSTVGDGLRLAVGTLTVLPVAPPRRTDRAVAAVAMVLAPVAALPVAAAAGLVVWAGVALDLPGLVTAILVVSALALGSGALHLDGLADTADGLAVQGDAARRLEVMQRGDVGPVGAVSLLLVLLLQVGALADLVGGGDPTVSALALVVGVVASRSVLPLVCVRGIAAARPTGLGAMVAGSVPWVAGVGVQVLVAAAAWLLFGWPAVIAVIAAVVVAAALLLWCRRTIGGVTGDVLGACVEVALAAYLVVLAA